MRNHLKNVNPQIDAIDHAILGILVENARVTLTELARRVGKSVPSISERIKRLEECGAIKGYTVDIDPAALGRPLAIMLRIRPVPGKLKEVAALIAEIPEITECVRVTGEDCYIARAYVRSVEDLEALIDRIVPNSMTTTSIIQSTPVERRLPPFASIEPR